MTRHLLEVDDLTPDELREVLRRAAEPALPKVLDGKGAALLFEKPSARTRHSTEMAVVHLGGHPIYVRAEEVGIDQRETAEDVACTLACYHAVICARVFEHSRLERMAAVDRIPVVNLLSESGHPVQALADLLTLEQEWGAVEGRTVAWVGDFSNVARSLARGVAMLGGSVRFACPVGYGPDEAELERLVVLGAGSVESGDRPADAVAGVDAVVTDAWYSMGQEAEAELRRRQFEGFTVDADLMAAAEAQAVFLHCLPAHRGEEVTSEVLDGPASRVWAEAANRMHSMRGLLSWLVEQSEVAP